MAATGSAPFPVIREAVASFPDREHFRRAVSALLAAGFESSELSVLATHRPLSAAEERPGELIAAGLGQKTGQSMGHIAMSGEHGAIESFAGLDIARKVFLHINNSNPAWIKGSEERKALESAGWDIPADGTEIAL